VSGVAVSVDCCSSYSMHSIVMSRFRLLLMTEHVTCPATFVNRLVMFSVRTTAARGKDGVGAKRAFEIVS